MNGKVSKYLRQLAVERDLETRKEREVLRQWWQGLPHKVRGRVRKETKW